MLFLPVLFLAAVVGAQGFEATSHVARVSSSTRMVSEATGAPSTTFASSSGSMTTAYNPDDYYWTNTISVASVGSDGRYLPPSPSFSASWTVQTASGVATAGPSVAAASPSVANATFMNGSTIAAIILGVICALQFLTIAFLVYRTRTAVRLARLETLAMGTQPTIVAAPVRKYVSSADSLPPYGDREKQ